jgi:hypothetical protein
MFFNMLGRSKPTEKCRVFSNVPKNFYKIDPFAAKYSAQHDLAITNGLLDDRLSQKTVDECLISVKREIGKNPDYKNLFKAVAIPFCFSIPNLGADLGTKLENDWLPLLKQEFERQVPGSSFKATLQGETTLQGSLAVSKNSGYDLFLEHCRTAAVAGYYFPTAFQEFDIASQRARISGLPEISDLETCLSGPFEIIYSLLSYPKLLFSQTNYSPILCASALEHKDPRMIMMFKSYGPHLEFWLMTQMLTPNKTQVSEQWSGGITIFRTI